MRDEEQMLDTFLKIIGILVVIVFIGILYEIITR